MEFFEISDHSLKNRDLDQLKYFIIIFELNEHTNSKERIEGSDFLKSKIFFFLKFTGSKVPSNTGQHTARGWEGSFLSQTD